MSKEHYSTTKNSKSKGFLDHVGWVFFLLNICPYQLDNEVSTLN